jgi:hypothetical protein
MTMYTGPVVRFASICGDLLGCHGAYLRNCLTFIRMSRRGTLARHDTCAFAGSRGGSGNGNTRSSFVCLVIIRDSDWASHVGTVYPTVICADSELDPVHQKWLLSLRKILT